MAKPRIDIPIYSAPITHDAPTSRFQVVFDPKGSVVGFIERITTPKGTPNERS